tara:strand:+ start:6034 stop:6459 length:426 start_codon:yes stop_codon:yes gene_type:complete
MKNVLLTVGGVIGMIGLGIATDLGGLLYKKETAAFRGKANAEHQIESAASRIQRYEEFFNICQSIQAKEAAIDTIKASMSQDNQLYSVSITSNQMARSTLIAEYNSKTAQSYTSARFKASNLPYRIDLSQYDGSNKTECFY